ncbi:Carbohydrate esterase 4 protein [Rhizophlyctis rosea]|uniref:Carbohydrate esterase 4 protein n=1 Tax=Rhizophlyctis rosea TaxID=64517 RepID=A0AAD5X2W2_9FUNG|nr:Carbohydrate esterase 4 protein [Rhizophlyctis rosea]
MTTRTTTSPTPTTGTRKADWDFCSTNGECANGCCANIYSNDGRFKCTPGGLQSYCTGGSGTTTSGPQPTSQPATARVYSQCNNPNQIAITFDDGPYQYTQELLNLFNSRNAKLTLFVNGLNWACIYDRADVLRSAYNQGHQIGSHTWSHSDLVTLSQSQLESEISRVDTALAKILGAKPTHMRPPYGSYNQNVVDTVGRFGYTSVDMWTFDSGDTQGLNVDQQFQRYQSSRSDVGNIALNHDVQQPTVQQLAPRILDWAQGRGLQIVTIGTCLGQSQTQWYRERTGIQGPRDGSWVC